MKKKRGNIKSRLRLLALGPLLCFGAATLIVAVGGIYTAMASETRDGLKNLAYALKQICYLEGEGDFAADGGVLLKGEKALDSGFSIVDSIKSVSGVDATVFFGDERLFTTVRRPDGSRITETHASPEVAQAVLEEGKDFFSGNVSVNDTPYFGYYTPLSDQKGKTVGMVFVGKTRSIVLTAVRHTVLMIFLCAALVGTAAALIAMSYADKIVYSLNKTREFLGSVARGNVEEDMDPYILNRDDEIGEMGSFAVSLKTAISELVSVDPLTGLYNRRTCEVILPNVIHEYEKYNTPSVLVIGDIDYFKNVNDTFGHPGGDAVLRELAAVFREHMERKGFVARWGGEEFMFIYERMDMERVRTHLEELTELIRSAKIIYNGENISITMTFGAAACIEGDDLKTLVRRADDNLYYGKKNGRNRTVISRPDGEDAQA